MICLSRFVFLVVFNVCHQLSLKQRDFRTKNKVLKEGQTKVWDHLQTIELEKLCIPLVSKVSEVEGMISFDHFYTFHRTLKRWTTGTLWRHKGLVAEIQKMRNIKSRVA